VSIKIIFSMVSNALFISCCNYCLVDPLGHRVGGFHCHSMKSFNGANLVLIVQFVFQYRILMGGYH